MEETGRAIICGVPTTLAVKGQMMMMMLFPKLTPVLSGYLDLLDLDTYIGVGRPIILIKEFLKSYPTVLI